MLNFFKNVLAVVVGVMISFFIGFIFIVGIIVSMSGLDSKIEDEENFEIDDNSVIVIDLNRTFSELGDENPIDFIEDDKSYSKYSVLKLANAIDKAKKDPKIVGMKLLGGYPNTGLSSIAYLERKLNEFKQEGKFVYAYADGFSEKGYTISSISDHIVMAPTGMLEFNGLSISVMYFKRMLEKMDVKIDVFKVGDFKSAVEPFIRENMSQENRLQLTKIAQEFNDYIVEKVAKHRGITKEKTLDVQNNMLVKTAKQAVYHKFIDALGFENMINEKIANKLNVEKDKIEFMEIEKYIPRDNKKGNIAVIVADGQLRGDKNEDGVIGGEETAKLIRKAREKDDYKAIVLRVNSPGGSLLASDKIWAEVQKTNGVKPIIVSMGDIAASGGYYISAAADKIIAEPTTITGSIGIFFLRLNIEKMLNEKMGIDRDYITTGKYSDIMNITRDLSDEEKQIFQELIGDGYDKFLNKVSIGRSMSKDLVEDIASGRVWTGKQALERKLVDKLGDINDAIDIAVETASIENPKVVYFPKEEEVFDKLMKKFKKKMAAVQIFSGSIEHLNPYIDMIKNMPNGVYAELPYKILVE